MPTNYFLDSNLLNGFQYPFSFLKAVELNLLDFDLWLILDSECAKNIMLGMKKRYPNSNYIPFAKIDGNDDVACFEMGKGEVIQIVHDYASEGYERRGKFETFWGWLEHAIHIMIEYNIEEEASINNQELPT
jgi:hypothetical protein